MKPPRNIPTDTTTTRIHTAAVLHPRQGGGMGRRQLDYPQLGWNGNGFVLMGCVCVGVWPTSVYASCIIPHERHGASVHAPKRRRETNMCAVASLGCHWAPLSACRGCCGWA
eukprot:8495923-Pyramimonas_sp.AAC.1